MKKTLNVALITGILSIVGSVAGIAAAVISGNYNASGMVGSVSGLLTGIGLLHHAATNPVVAAPSRPPVSQPLPDTSLVNEVPNE